MTHRNALLCLLCAALSSSCLASREQVRARTKGFAEVLFRECLEVSPMGFGSAHGKVQLTPDNNVSFAAWSRSANRCSTAHSVQTQVEIERRRAEFDAALLVREIIKRLDPLIVYVRSHRDYRGVLNSIVTTMLLDERGSRLVITEDVYPADLFHSDISVVVTTPPGVGNPPVRLSRAARSDPSKMQCVLAQRDQLLHEWKVQDAESYKEKLVSWERARQEEESTSRAISAGLQSGMAYMMRELAPPPPPKIYVPPPEDDGEDEEDDGEDGEKGPSAGGGSSPGRRPADGKKKKKVATLGLGGGPSGGSGAGNSGPAGSGAAGSGAGGSSVGGAPGRPSEAEQRAACQREATRCRETCEAERPSCSSAGVDEQAGTTALGAEPSKYVTRTMRVHTVGDSGQYYGRATAENLAMTTAATNAHPKCQEAQMAFVGRATTPAVTQCKPNAKGDEFLCTVEASFECANRFVPNPEHAKWREDQAANERKRADNRRANMEAQACGRALKRTEECLNRCDGRCQ